jgi:hypothetical protein
MTTQWPKAAHSRLINPSPLSFADRVYRHLLDAMKTNQEVILKLSWGSLNGIPTYLDEICVELVYLYVSDLEEEADEEDICWRTVWLVKLEDICALSYSSESWSKERFDQLLHHPHCPLQTDRNIGD